MLLYIFQQLSKVRTRHFCQLRLNFLDNYKHFNGEHSNCIIVELFEFSVYIIHIIT